MPKKLANFLFDFEINHTRMLRSPLVVMVFREEQGMDGVSKLSRGGISLGIALAGLDDAMRSIIVDHLSGREDTLLRLRARHDFVSAKEKPLKKVRGH